MTAVLAGESQHRLFAGVLNGKGEVLVTVVDLGFGLALGAETGLIFGAWGRNLFR